MFGPDKRTSNNKNEPVNGNTCSKQSVDEVFEVCEEDKKFTVTIPEVKVYTKYANTITNAKETITENQPIKKGF